MLSLFSRLLGPSHHDPTDLDRPLLHWSRHDALTVRQSFAGIGIFGETGSGKTSSSGRQLALAKLNAGYGGLVLCPKYDDANRWREYAALTGRADDLRAIAPEGPWRVNALDMELSAHPNAIATNIASLLTTVMDKATGHAESGAGTDRFWRDAAIRMLVQSTTLLLLAEGRVTVGDLYRVIISLPRSPEEARSESWKQGSYCFQCLRAADQRVKTPSQTQDFELTSQYMLFEMSTLSERTRSSIVAVVTTVLDPLMRGFARELIGTDTTLNPAEAATEGKIVVVDLPTLVYRDAGVFVSLLLKASFQRAILARDVSANPRPVFLFIDEYPVYCTPDLDCEFLATCRSSHVSTVLLSQNINLIRGAAGAGDRGKAKAEAVLGNLSTKLFHANTCAATNEYAANIIGKKLQFMANGGTNTSGNWAMNAVGLGERSTAHAGFSEVRDYDCPPAIYPTLKTGGPANNFECQAIVTTGGRTFSDTGSIWRPVTFSQK